MDEVAEAALVEVGEEEAVVAAVATEEDVAAEVFVVAVEEAIVEGKIPPL